VDLGDVARALGNRVRSLRDNTPSPSPEGGPKLQRPPSRPTAMQVRTETFAVREEIVSGPAPATRKLASSTPPPAQTHAHSRTRLVRGGLAWIGIGTALAIFLLAFRIGRGAASAPRAVVSAAAASVAPALSPPAQDAILPWMPPAAATAAPNQAPHAALPLSDPGDRAQLVLLGDETNVSVDGSPRGPAPVRIGVDPGPHSVLFTFPATGESKAVSLTLRAGEQATVRADFTGAQPRIRVQR